VAHTLKSMSTTTIHLWHDGTLQPLDRCDLTDTRIVAADSWLVRDGSVLALDLHRSRFLGAVDRSAVDGSEQAEVFWEAAIAAIPRTGDWFPRVELQRRGDGELLVFRLRSAPELRREARLATSPVDPRRTPGTKGPDTEVLLAARTDAQHRGADEAVILSPDGYIVEGATSALLWWRGDALCAPSPELERVDSVTARSVIALATALGIDVYYESVTPDDLDGLETWMLSALHGIRIVTGWVDGPAMAEEPGRLGVWRARLERLRRPLPDGTS
jgi:branched-subunit amino acid aminotransferase/4-amino-4-deoxychorismate lyase